MPWVRFLLIGPFVFTFLFQMIISARLLHRYEDVEKRDIEVLYRPHSAGSNIEVTWPNEWLL